MNLMTIVDALIAVEDAKGKLDVDLAILHRLDEFRMDAGSEYHRAYVAWKKKPTATNAKKCLREDRRHEMAKKLLDELGRAAIRAAGPDKWKTDVVVRALRYDPRKTEVEARKKRIEDLIREFPHLEPFREGWILQAEGKIKA